MGLSHSPEKTGGYFSDPDLLAAGSAVYTVSENGADSCPSGGTEQMMTPWAKKKLLKKLEASFGKEPVKDYFPGDMEYIRTFYDACRSNEPDRFHVDETTWKDLDMDDVFKRVNACQCTAGEQYLYYMLRTPMKQPEYQEQRDLIRLMDTRPETRINLQLLLSRISSDRDVDLTTIFYPTDNSPFWLIIYCLIVLMLAASVLAVIFLGVTYIFLPLVIMAATVWFHTFRRDRCEHEIRRVNYCVSLILSLNRLKKEKLPGLDPYLSDACDHLNHMKPILRSGPVLSAFNMDMYQAAAFHILMIDLFAFELLKKRLAKYHDHFLAVHKAIGRLDASVAIASCRAELPVWCEPEIDYAAEHPYLRMEGMVHPLLKNPVPNDLIPEKSMLITGSNASGKSTCLRTAVICAIMAQTLCTCTCGSYTGSIFRIYTSLALSDNLLAGESYYIAEIKSLKRILDERNQDGFILCAIDEVLQGTNTIERIAASAEILKALNHPGILCLIATHDSELCAISGGDYQLAHFEETVSDQQIHFDYKLKPGPAETRNAILLLKLMGFDNAIVSAASGRADNYIKTGKWTPTAPEQEKA